MNLKLVGFKALIDKEDSSLIKGYSLYFMRDARENGENEYGNLCKVIFAFPKQIENVSLKVGSNYTIFTAYESTTKKELFAGMMEARDEK